jgi:hypothetical protein
MIISKHLGKPKEGIMASDLNHDALAFYLHTAPNLIRHTGRGRTEIILADNPADRITTKTLTSHFMTTKKLLKRMRKQGLPIAPGLEDMFDSLTVEKGESKKRRPLSTDELRCLFE